MLAHKAAEYLTAQQGLRMVDFDVEKLSARILLAANPQEQGRHAHQARAKPTPGQNQAIL
jgi:hypothetical protein